MNSEPTRKNRLLKTEDIVDTLSEFVISRMENMHTSLPGKIETYDEGSRKASVKLLVQAVRRNGDILDVPIIQNVPVIFPSSKVFSITYPLSRGDTGLVMFAETGIGNFLNSGGTTEVEADSPAKFQLTDAVFLPGLYPFSKYPSGESNIEIDASGTLTLFGKNGGSLEATVLGETLKGLIEQILDGIVAITIPSPLGPLGPPVNSATFVAIKAQLITMLSQGVKNN